MGDDAWERDLLEAVERAADPGGWLPEGGSFDEITLQGDFPETVLRISVRFADPPRSDHMTSPFWDVHGRPQYRDPDGETEDVQSAASEILTNVMENAGRGARRRQPER